MPTACCQLACSQTDCARLAYGARAVTAARTESYEIGLWLLSITAALTLVLTLTVVRATARAHEEGKVAA